MENLPFVVLKELFMMMDNLNAVIRCSHVCRNWRAAYQTMIGPETACLYFQKYISLNHRLFYTNDRVFSFQFLRLKAPAPPRHELRFLDFLMTRTHFANLRKLVIFYFMELRDEDHSEYKIHFRNQLNNFPLLEYVEIHSEIEMLEGCEIDLLNLKVLCLDTVFCERWKCVPIRLNTPSLEAMRVNLCCSGLEFHFPHQLKHLNLTVNDPDFKFHTELPNLECIIFDYSRRYDQMGVDSSGIFYDSSDEETGWLRFTNREDTERPKGARREERLFGKDFLKSLPGLKLLVSRSFGHLDLAELEREKLEFGLKNLKILEITKFFKDGFRAFDYANWKRYVDELNFSYWPDEIDIWFDKLLTHQVPLDLFKKNFFRIAVLKIRHVSDQRLLADFLRKTDVSALDLEPGCNLGQNFFDEIADSVSVRYVRLYESVWDRLSDVSVLSRLNMNTFEVHFEEFLAEAIVAVLSNPACFEFGFYDASHRVYKIRSWQRDDDDEFYCSCWWYSWKHPDRQKKGSIEVTIDHILNSTPSNETLGMFQFKAFVMTGHVRDKFKRSRMTWEQWKQFRGGSRFRPLRLEI